MLRKARWKSALSVLGSIAFVAAGVFMAFGPIRETTRYSPEIIRLVGWVCVLFFGAAGLMACLNLVRPTEVVLSPEGFQVVGVRRKPVVPWRDVRRFFIAKVQGNKFVCYELDRTPTNLQRAMGADQPGVWGDGQIPAHLQRGVDQVLTVLEEWRGRYGI